MSMQTLGMSESRTHKANPKSEGIWDDEDDDNDNDYDDQLHINYIMMINYKAYVWHPFLILLYTTKKLRVFLPKKKLKSYNPFER